LLIRGLIEKVPNPADARSFLYQTTTEFLMHLGVAGTKDLPEFEKLTGSIKLPQTPGLEQPISTEQTAQNIEPLQNKPAQQSQAEQEFADADDDETDIEENG
jgi:hypothetical protein